MFENGDKTESMLNDEYRGVGHFGLSLDALVCSEPVDEVEETLDLLPALKVFIYKQLGIIQ